jgi:acetate kinase
MNNLLIINAGSATLKWALFERDSLNEQGRGVVERIGEKESFAEWRLLGKLAIKYLPIKNHKQALAYIVKILAWHNLSAAISLVGHRIVHGGHEFAKPTRINRSMLKSIKRWQTLAPLHNSIELNVIKAALKLLPKAEQWAVFDTAWFVNLPPKSQYYALPFKLADKYGIKRYGFHGLSHAYVVNQAAGVLNKPLAQLNLISCHLGSGCSVAAVRKGKPVDISMGFTPLEGLVMGTRAGDLDSGIILHLLRQPNINLKKLADILNHEAGLKGMTGVADMREILVRAGYEVLGFKTKQSITSLDRKQAKLALAVFLYRLQKYIGAYAAILAKVDAIIFTGGIGERNEVIRNLTLQGLPTLKHIPVLVIPTNEELAIARQILRM